MSHTYAILKVSKSTYDEISSALKAAGYADQFNPDGENGVVIDMHGIALAAEKPRVRQPEICRIVCICGKAVDMDTADVLDCPSCGRTDAVAHILPISHPDKLRKIDCVCGKSSDINPGSVFVCSRCGYTLPLNCPK